MEIGKWEVGGGGAENFWQKRGGEGKMGLGLSRNEGLPYYIEFFLEIPHDVA